MHSHASAKSLNFPTDQISENFHLRNKRIKRPENRVKSVSQVSPVKKSMVLHSKHQKGQKYEPPMINIRDLLLKPDIDVTTQAHEKLECYCNVCIAQNGVKIEPEEISRDEFFKGFDFGLSTKNSNETDREFSYIMKRLMPKKNATHSMRLPMPETLFFVGGFPSFLVHLGKDKSLKFVKDKEKLALHEVRKFFQETFLRIEEEELNNSIDQNNQTQSQSQRKESSVDLSSNETARLGSDSMPSHVLDLLDPKDADAKRRVRRRTTKIKTTTFTNQEVALIKFNDDSTTILTDNEFEALMARKKFDPYWRKVTYIQNFRKLARNLKTLQRVYFVLDREAEHPLFKRASKEASQFKGHVPQASGQYIPAYEEELFERSIKETNERDYCLYILMKIYHFMEITQNVKITKMGGDFVKDERGVIYLIDVCRLHSEVIEIEKPASPERRPVVYPVYDDEKSLEKESEKRKEHVDFLVNMMKEKYKNAKQEANFEIPFGREYEEDLSDKVFSFLYPEMPVKLSTILNTNTKHAEFKRIFDNIVIKNNFRKDTRRYVGLQTEEDQPPEEEIIQQQRTLINFNEQQQQQQRASITRGGSLTVRRPQREKSFLEYSVSERTLPSIGHVELSRTISKGRIVYQPVDHSDKKPERTNSTPSLRKVVRGVGLKHRVSPVSKRQPTEPNFFGNRITIRRVGTEEDNPPPPTERRENPRVGIRPSNPIKIEHLNLESSREKLTSKISPETYRKLLEPIKLLPSALLSVKSHDEISRNLMRNKHKT